MKKLMRINAFVAMVLSMLIVMTPFSYSILDWEEEEQEAQTGESIIVNVGGYEPTILPSSVIEDGDVPVYVYLTGMTPGTILKRIAGSTSNIEPLYGNVDIKQVYIRPENEETLNYVRGNPKYVKPRKVSIDNLGYLIVTLKQIRKEADVPDEIKLNMRAEITFENAERLYSMIEQDLIIPEDPDEAAWREKPIDDYRFFAGRGAIRASSISENGADLTVYGGMDLQWPFTGSPRPLEDLELSKGETSDPIRMSAASDFMTNAFRVKLTDIVDPSQKRARIRVNVNGEEKEYIVTEGSKLYPGSSLTVKEINSIKDSRTSKITYEIVIRGPRDTTRISKTFFEKIAEGAADLLGLVSDDAEEAVRDAAGVDRTGSAAATAEGRTASEIAAAAEIASTPIPGDEKCTALGGTCADTTYAMCYDDNEELIDFVRLKCGGGTARQCCVGRVESTSTDAIADFIEDNTGTASASRITGSETLIASNTGEGVCKNKVIVLREGDSPEQWLEIITQQATQEMVYCTAIEEYKRVASLYFGIENENGVLYEDMANFRIGEIYYWLGDSASALEYYNKALKNNKGEFIPLARARIDELTEEALHHTRFKVGEFEENGVSIRVKVMEVLWQDESSKPSATVDVENEGTKKLKVGDSIFSYDATDPNNGELKYNWIVKDINFGSIIAEQKYRTETPEGYRPRTKLLQADSETKLDYGSTYRTARLKSVDMKKYAIVTVIPGTGAPLVSQTNFTVHIPIEKRAIDLTPDEISGKINDTQAIIDDLDDIINTLNDVVVLWKKVCLVTFGYLTIKNSFFTGLSRTQARRFAMHGPDGNSGWDAYCRANSGENRLYERYEECIIENSANIEATTDASQNAIETVNNEMKNYQNQPWYGELTKNYTNLGEYRDYMGTDLYSPEQLRDYRYWQLMKQTPVYNNLKGSRQGDGYSYNLRLEVDTRLSSMAMGNEEQRDAYLGAVSDVEAHYENFDTLSEQEKTALFSDLYGSHIANPDTRSGDFSYIEVIGVTPIATIRKEGRELYSNTPHGRITLHEATVNDYQKGLADAMSTESGRMPEGMTAEMKERLTAESVRMESQYEGNPNAPLRTNQGQVYVDDEGYFYAPMTTAYITGEPRNDYAPGASAEFYPNGKPYCIPTGQGNYVKILDFYRDGSPSVIQQWNVGTDGLMCTEDDLLVQHQSMLERPESESTQRRLVEQASSVGTRSEGQVLSAAGRDFPVSTSRAQTDSSRSSATCYDVMDPDDCRLLFGVCDPVMCPPSRFNLGGSWQVDDVVQTGLIGSLVLGLHNFDLPYEPVPICLTGVLAGLQNIKSVLRGYVECLKTAQVQGISVGICDKIRSVFICELIWKEAIAILNIKGGIFNWISQTFFDQGSGGGEYLTFESSISNVEDSVSFFTEQYATTAFASYTGRSTEELGTTICKQAIFGQTPAFGEFFDQLAQPESPPQYTAFVTETGYSETQQQSRYEVFYHIYAGEDNPATYSVTLKNSITGDTRYFTERCEGRQGSIEKGGIASFNIDCIGPKGFDNVCITLNGNTECGFGKISTDFALNYLNDLVVSDEAQRQIDSEEKCSPSSPRTSPSLGSIPLPGNIGLLSSGVQRVCSIANPGQGTNPIDWKEVGTCGKDSTGRSMGKCWIDMRTVSIHDTDRMQSVTDALDEIGFRERREEMGLDLLEEEESANELKRIDETAAGICEGTKEAECGEITNAMSAYRYLESVTVIPKIAAKAGYRYSCLMEKAADKCALFDLRREVSRLGDDFEYDLEAIYYEFLDRFESEVAPFMRGDELPPAFVNEYQARVTERFEEAKTNLTNMRGMNDEKFAEYVGGIQAIYDRAYNMEDPFVFKIEVSVEEQGQTSQIEENTCMECGDGIGTICKKRACHDIGKTSSNRQLYCYYERGAGIAIGGNDYTAFNKCHTCSRISTCAELTDDKDMCESAACTSMANNGEGLNCKYAGQCIEKPASEVQASSGSTTQNTAGTLPSSLATSTTGSSTNCRPTPPDFFKKPLKTLNLDLTKIGDKCDHEVMSGSSLKTKFPIEMINAAIAAQRETGVPAGYMLAQARHETGRSIIEANGDITKLKMSPWGRKCTTASPRIPDYWINTGTVSGIDCTAQAQCPDGQSLNAAEEATIKARCENAGCVWTKTTEWCEALRSTTPGQQPPRMCTSTCFASAMPIGQQTLSQAEFYRDTIGGRYCQSCGPITDYMGSVTGFAARMGCVLPGAVHDTNWDNCLYKIIWENCLEDESNTDMIEFLQRVSKTCITGTDPSTYTGTDMYAEGYTGSAASTTTRSFVSTTPAPTAAELAKWAWPAEGQMSGFWNPPEAASAHNALDISNVEGTPIYASYAGRVTQVETAVNPPECDQWYRDCGKNNENKDSPECGSRPKPTACRNGGLTIRIVDSQGREHYYAHLDEVLVSAGQTVSKCQKIALLGSTGNALDAPHLHYAVYNAVSGTSGRITYNPMIYLNPSDPAARPARTSATTGNHCPAS
ncbi:MAG: peptidoglycan DD-metalloendopeptidase family protein [Nanoarchaeota archaeon]